MRRIWFRMRRVWFKRREMNTDDVARLEQEGSDSAPNLETLDDGVCYDFPGPIDVPWLELTLTSPAQMDILSIDAGFDRSPVLQSIRDHYRDLKYSSSDDFASELSRDFEGVELKIVSFSLKQLKAATNNFNSTNKLGEGSFGPVYKVFQLKL